MIRFEPIHKPSTFAAKAEVPGHKWLAEHPDAERPKDYWTPFKPALADGFDSLCAYSAMYEPVGTVDHFISCHEDISKAYEWENYRYCSGWLNSSKQNINAAEIFDPFEVEDGWFEIILPSLQLVVSNAIPEKYLKRAEFVLKRLHLSNDERILRQRQAWYEMYLAKDLSIKGLHKKAPLIARAVDAQNSEA